MDGAKVFLLLQLLSCAYGKHHPKPHHNERKSYPRQMIIPNKFIPMLKQSSLFKSRSSSNDLSSFLQPMSHEHDSVTGQTRQNLMNSMGMDPGQSQGAGTGDTNGMGGMGQAGGMGDAGGMGGMGGMGGAGGMGEGGMNGMGGAGGMGMNGGMGGMGETGGMGMNGGMGGTGMEGAGGFGGLNDQMKAMNEIGGMGNSDASQSPLGGNMQGENGMDPMNNGGAEGMNSDANNPPAGDPMGTLKDMLSNQGTNAALGTDSQAFGPGGSANSNVLAMLNQIVGKEMPGESPVDPSSSSEQVWNRLQKTFDSQKPSGVPYIDQNANEHVQQDIQVSNSNNKMNVADKPNPNTPAIPINNNSTPNISTKKPPISNPGNASPLNANSATSNAPMAHASTDSPATNPTSTTNIISKPRSQKESHANALTKTTSNMAEMDTEEDRPLSADMIKFLKGVKFVVSQEPGNDIILGKKFSSDVQHDLTLDFKEENGVIKNIVSATNKLSRADRMWPMNTSKWERGERYGNVETANPKGIASSFAVTHLLSKPNAKKKNPVEYIKAAKVLERASKKLKDPIAKKSTEIAVASILKVAHALGENKNLSSNAAVDLLNGGDVNNKLSEKYIEAARVLGTASKKLADPVAKKSTEIGIASILKVIALGDYPTSKKTFVPSLPRSHSLFNTHLNTLVDKRHENIANEIVVAVKRTLKLPKMKKPSH